MEQWEYKVMRGAPIQSSVKDEKMLNDLGEQGWELVSVYGVYFYFKRKARP